MKLKNYLSAKRLRRKFSKINVDESHINNSFTDFKDNDLGNATATSKDDMFLRPKKKGVAVGVRSDMTKSLTGYLPSNCRSRTIQTDMPLSTIETNHLASQTNLEQRSDNMNVWYTSNLQLCTYRDSLEGVEVGTEDENSTVCQCNSRQARECCRNLAYDPPYHSLPSSQPSHQAMQDVSYNSLPSSMTQSVHMAHASRCQAGRLKRSRIKTNPWLPLPDENADTLKRRPRNVNKRMEPRLSQFISEVEQMMRRQLGTDEVERRCLSHSNTSLASTCSTATEIPERKLDDETYTTMASPSEGYKSACESTDLNLADTESFSDSRASSCSDLSKQGGSETSRSGSGNCPPSLQDFNNSLQSHNWASSASSLLSDSMFMSAYSPKYEALEDKVRKLCQSTTDLDEKMRLARLESSFIEVS